MLEDAAPDALPEGVRPPTQAEGDAEIARLERVRKFLALNHERWKTSNESGDRHRREAEIDDAFAALDQWDPQIKALRDDPLAPKPCLTVDKIGQPIRQVTNAQKRARFGIKILPKGDGATQDDATVRQGLIRQIEHDSNAMAVYAWAFKDAVTSGLGWFRVVTEAASDTATDESAFDFELKIKRILNKFSVYPDPSFIEPDGSDMKYCYVTEDLGVEEYKFQYPDSKLASLDEWSGLGDTRTTEWFTSDSARVAEVWYTEPKRVTIVALNDGRQTNYQFDVQLPKTATKGSMVDVPKIGSYPILNRRDKDLRTVKWAKINGMEILEGNEDLTAGRNWDGEYIPIVPVIGEELYDKGKRIMRGMVRSARDAQRLYNYQVSALAERLATDTKVPWVGYSGQFKGHENKWNTAHIKNWPYLEVNMVDLNGKVAPLPQRNAIEPPIQALVVGIQQADHDIKATTGFFDPSLGNMSQERSGKAINALRDQGELGSAHFQESLATAITHCGRILNDLLGKVYTRPGRVQRIIEGDDQDKSVMLGMPYNEGQNGQPQALRPGEQPIVGKTKNYRLDRGSFSVVVDVGRHFATRRLEGAYFMGQLMDSAPQLTPVVADLYIAKQDFDGAPEIAARLKKALPPELQDEKNEPIPPQAKAAIDALSQQHDAMVEIINKLTTERDQKTLELQNKADIASMQEDTKLEIAKLHAELEKLKIGHQSAHEQAMNAVENQQAEVRQFGEQAHERGMAAQTAAFTERQAEQDAARQPEAGA